MIRTLSTGDARERFAEIIKDALEEKRTLITRHGKEVAAVVPISDVQLRPGSVMICQTPQIYNFTPGESKSE